MRKFEGSRFLGNGPVVLGCISPEASDLLDRVMESYREHYNPKFHTSSPDDVHQFAYWLIRWSGLVQPMAASQSEESIKDKGL